jgi:hypothetical protein
LPRIDDWLDNPHSFMLRSVLWFLAGSLLLVRTGSTQESAPMQMLGGRNLQGWSGLEPGADSGKMPVPGDATFRYPDGPRGAYRHGFRLLNDGAADWGQLYGLRYGVELPDGREVELVTTIRSAGSGTAATEGVHSVTRLQGQGPHTVTLPWTAFAFEQARSSFLQTVKSLTVAARYTDGSSDATGKITLSEPQVIQAPLVALATAVRGKSAPHGQTVEYVVQVGNATAREQAVELSFVRHGWEEMKPTVEPAALTLAAGETKTCTVRVPVPDRVPPGGHEEQVLQAVANGDAAAASTLSLTTVSELPHPYIMHTPKRWQEVRDKVEKYPWAREAQDGFLKKAEAWKVPEVARPPHNDPNDNFGPFLFATTVENDLLACAYSWQLTGNKEYAGKVAEFLRRLSDPQNGYPQTFRACNQSLVQEGHFFQHIAMSYDMILDSGVLSDADRSQIDATLRIFMETINRENERGSINNWNLSEVTGAFYCALAMQDLAAADRFFSGPCGIQDQLAKGTMDDGWWYECAIGYNMWCASEFTQAALAYEPFGVNFKTAWLPANYSHSAMLTSELSGGNQPKVSDPEQARKPFGMDPDIYGPITRPFRTITDLWNGLLPFIDYRGVMFGVNDSTESKVAGNRPEVGGQPFEIAYFAYRDPRYAAIIKVGGGKRDLLYGVPELPAHTPEEFRECAYADNVGLAMLRSQTPDRPIREQIQAALHYGTHGWAHGHYDRTDLVSLERDGRSFWSPETIWWGYEPYMYKFYVQTSVNHNMVVVDQKMQEAAPGERLLWHTGKLMQATAVQTTARWSNPPYGGMVYDYVPVKTFAEKTMREGRSVPIPANPPDYGTLTGFTEPVLQRRLMVVTDDYVVLADYTRGTQPHTFESLLQLKGFKELTGEDKKFLRHDAQWNADPVGSAQFVTDADWYSVKAPAVGRFEERFGPGGDEAVTRSVGNEDGVLKLDVHSLWPPSQEIMVATAPEPYEVEKRLSYAVRGDGKMLAEGKTGAWILGAVDVDVPLEGVTQLELETSVEISRKPTVFWGGARIVTGDGKEIPLSELAPEFSGIVQPKEPNRDYFGGPIKIAGVPYANATPGQPQSDKQPGTVRVNLAGRDAVRFKATLGSDYPPGPEEQRRKVYAVRAPRASEASFLTVIEPYEDKPVVKSAVALGPDRLRVELLDGRTQEITIENLTGSGKDIAVKIDESKAGTPDREEVTSQP